LERTTFFFFILQSFTTGETTKLPVKGDCPYINVVAQELEPTSHLHIIVQQAGADLEVRTLRRTNILRRNIIFP
jgi:hypothetical protein